MKPRTRRWLRHNRLNLLDCLGLIIAGLVISFYLVGGPWL